MHRQFVIGVSEKRKEDDKDEESHHEPDEIENLFVAAGTFTHGYMIPLIHAVVHPKKGKRNKPNNERPNNNTHRTRDVYPIGNEEWHGNAGVESW